VFTLVLGSAIVSCTFSPSGQVGGTDGSTEPEPDADPLSPDANPSVPDARPADARVAAPDARLPPDPPDDCEAWMPRPRHFDPCAIPAPSAELILTASGEYVYDTDDHTLTDPGGNDIAHASGEIAGAPPVQVVSVDRFLVGANARLRVVGSKPLLVASWSEISVEGTIDVSSSASGLGAGASTGSCNAAGVGAASASGGGGGGGGGLGGDGGQGGAGSAGSGGSGGSKGTQVPAPTTVRGGCKGATGGTGTGSSSGAAGAGGGALQLTALRQISITGALHAGGQGGGGADGTSQRRGGGGGGGSGGLLGLESPSITVGPGAVLTANGGGGGEGTEDTAADRGDDGRPDESTAAGGSGGDGGNGGTGGARASTDGLDGGPGRQSGASRRAGGGGGGGSAGYIILEGSESVGGGAVLSPQPELR
jgi:hypothetical protein